MHVMQYLHHHTYSYAQMSLQTLEGTIAAASFADDLQRWQKQLQTIEGVLGVWLKVQQLWTQLEGVCLLTRIAHIHAAMYLHIYS